MLILLTQEGKIITYLVLGVEVRVTLVTLLAAGATSHAAEAISREAAQPAQVLGSLLVLAPITFIFIATQARGRVGGTGVDVAHSDHHSSFPASVVLLPRPSLILVLILVLVIVPRFVLAVLVRPVLVAVLVTVLVLHLLRVASMKCPSLPHRKHVCAVLHVVTRFLCSLSNRLVSNTSSSYTSMLNSSSGKDIK
jgi:hypothetical protein